MTRTVFATLFVVGSCIVASADEPSALPNDVPPVVGTAIALPPVASNDKEWSVRLTVPKVKWEVIGEERPKLDWPRFKVTAENASLTLPMAYEPASQLSEVSQNRILDLKGKRLSREVALKRLATSTPVLVSVSGRMPDPLYLQTTRSDTLIVILGIPETPASDLLPQPASQPQRP
jgi:hypothetical protein